jgi:hypothetical protein
MTWCDDVVLTWKRKTWTNGRLSHDPIRGCHVAGKKITMTTRDQILKKIKSLAGPPNLADHAKLGHILTVGILDRATAKIGGATCYMNTYITTKKSQKGEAHEFDPETSSPFNAFIFTPKPTGQRPMLVSMPTKMT